MHVLKSALPAGIAIATAGFWYPGSVFSPTTEASPGPMGAAVHATHSAQQRGEIVLRRQFDIGPGGTLHIDIPDGDVEVETYAPGSGVEVEVLLSSRDMEWARERFDRMEFEAEATGNTVTVTASRVRTRRSDWGRRRGRGRGFGILTRVRVPRRFNADITTEDGDIFLADMHGNIVLNSSDGDIELGAIRGEELSIETSDGDITVDALEVTRTDIRTSDGDIDIRSAVGDVQATTSDGDIRLHLRQDADVRLRTSDGDITIYAPATLAAEIDFDGEDLYVARGFEIAGRISRRRVSGRLNGGGPLLAASTHDGSITLRQDGR